MSSTPFQPFTSVSGRALRCMGAALILFMVCRAWAAAESPSEGPEQAAQADAQVEQVFKVGDRITHINGNPVNGLDDVRIGAALAESEKPLTLTVERKVGDKVQTLELKVAGEGLLAFGSDLQPAESVEAEPQVEAHLVDGGTMHLDLLEEQLEFVTPYGKLLVPVKDIVKIQCASRLSAKEAAAIPKLVRQLGAEDFQLREDATRELAAMGPKAYAALQIAMTSAVPEIVRRAGGLIEKLKQTHGDEKLVSYAKDVIQTHDSKIAGRLTASVLKVRTKQFGELSLKLADLRELRRGEVPSDLPADAPPAPANMTGMGDKRGQTVIFKVTGGQIGSGTVWGTDVYTLDTSVALAAVHAGVVKPGETKVVRILILGQTDGFVGTTRNGVSSHNYGSYPGAFKFVR